jgi:hypothetical protein
MEWFTANDETAADGAVFDDASSVLRDWVLAGVCRDIFVAQRAASKEVRRDRRAGLPIAVQGVAFFITWTIRRHADCGGTTFWSQIWYTSAAERWSRNALVSQQRKRHDAKESAT